MNFDYEQIYSTGRTVKVERFTNIDFIISNYTIFVETFGTGTETSYNDHFIIEFENLKKKIGLLEITIPNTWTSIKNHLKVGTQVKASGLYHYNKNGDLSFIQIEQFTYKDIHISNKEILSSQGKTGVNRELLKNKKILTMLIIWIVSLFLMIISIKIFGLLFLIDTIIMATYATINNKKLGINADDLLEKSGLEKIEQQYKKVSK